MYSYLLYKKTRECYRKLIDIYIQLSIYKHTNKHNMMCENIHEHNVTFKHIHGHNMACKHVHKHNVVCMHVHIKHDMMSM